MWKYADMVFNAIIKTRTVFLKTYFGELLNFVSSVSCEKYTTKKCKEKTVLLFKILNYTQRGDK